MECESLYSWCFIPIGNRMVHNKGILNLIIPEIQQTCDRANREKKEHKVEEEKRYYACQVFIHLPACIDCDDL